MIFWVWVVALGASISSAVPVEDENDMIALIKKRKLFPSLYAYRRSGFPILPRTPVKVSSNLGDSPEFHLVYRNDHVSELRFEYTPVGTVYSKNLLDALDGKSWHVAAEDQEATRFMLWEMTNYPSPAALYDLMASNPAFTSHALISENFEIYKFIPEILARAALENLDLFEKLSTYGRLINVKDRFGHPINSANVMRLTQWLQIVHDSVDKVHRGHAQLSLSVSDWDDVMSTALCRTAEVNGDRVAARLLADPNIMRIFHKEKMGEFVKVVNRLGISERILTSMLMSHVVKKVPGYTWAWTLYHFLKQRMDAQVCA